MPYVSTSDLPDSLRAALRELGYHRPDVAVEVHENASRHDVSGAGYRAYCCVVDLATGRRRIERGSWGGPNPYQAPAVDRDQAAYAIPAGAAVINGREGGAQPVSATITISPANAAALLPAAADISRREAWILYCYKALTSAGRKREFEEGGAGGRPPSEAELDALAERGLLKRAKNGRTSITTAGKNALEQARKVHYGLAR
jgi:hypothetical protein